MYHKNCSKGIFIDVTRTGNSLSESEEYLLLIFARWLLFQIHILPQRSLFALYSCGVEDPTLGGT